VLVLNDTETDPIVLPIEMVAKSLQRAWVVQRELKPKPVCQPSPRGPMKRLFPFLIPKKKGISKDAIVSVLGI